MTPEELRSIDAWWRAANYLAVGQIYLLDNPLLRKPLRPEHVKTRLLGHWGFLGIAIDPARSSRLVGDREISRDGSVVRTFVAMATEDLEIARQVREVMAIPYVGSRGR